MIISIIIVNYKGLPFTLQCLESLYRFHSSSEYEVIVVDNNSNDGSQVELEKLYPSVRYIGLLENKGFGSANNVGASIAKGKYFFFVNNDTLFNSETISSLLTIIESQNNIGIVGPRLYNDDGTFQLSYGIFPTIVNEVLTKRSSTRLNGLPIDQVKSDNHLEVNWVTGAALMIKNSLYQKIGGFDERYFMYFEDIDLCRSVNNLGFKSIYVPNVSMIHLGGKSYSKNDSVINYQYRKSQLRFYDKNNSIFQRIAVRIYLFIKFSIKIFHSQDRITTIKIIKRTFSWN